MNKDEILEELFLNKLNLEDGMRSMIKKIIHPWNNMKDYIKYGDMFLDLKLEEK